MIKVDIPKITTIDTIQITYTFNKCNFTAFPKKDGCVVMADASTSGIFTITGAMEFFFNGLSIAKRRIRAFKKP
jgi:hypothetical protein